MNRARWYALATTLAVFLIDRASKVWIERNVGPLEVIPVIPEVFNIVYTRNPGAAFGLFAGAPEAVRMAILVGLTGVVTALIAHLLWQATRSSDPGSRLSRLGLPLLLGGAAGNLYDRVARGSVTDFLQVFLGSYEWPSFNAADSAISVGVALLAIDILFARRTSVGDRKKTHVPETHPNR
jgi:signal peptidase II